MSSDLERRLREGRETLPEPDASATERARERALSAIRRRRPRARVATLIVIAFVAVLGVGVGLGSLIAPSGTAAPGPVGTGFLPGPGWTVLQTGEDPTLERQALAVATNVRLHPEDDARGIRGSSGLPYSTLLELPASGVVIVALFTRRESEPWNDEYFPKRELPLRVRDAFDSIAFNYQMRPERPLGQYELRATAGGHHIVLHFYFGSEHPSAELIAAAQRQLDRLVVASESRNRTQSSAPSTSRAAHDGVANRELSASRIIDRTFACRLVTYGGVGDLDLWTTIRETDRFGFFRSAHLVVRTGTTLPDENLVLVRAQTQGFLGGPPPFPGPAGVYAHTRRCQPSSAKVRLSPKGFPGPPAGFSSDPSCSLRGRVVVRVRAVLAASARWGRAYAPYFVGARSRVEEASVGVRAASSDAPLAYMTVDRAGRTKLWSDPSCR